MASNDFHVSKYEGRNKKIPELTRERDTNDSTTLNALDTPSTSNTTYAYSDFHSCHLKRTHQKYTAVTLNTLPVIKTKEMPQLSNVLVLRVI